MRPPEPIPHLHRFARFERWAKLWLLAFAGHLIACFTAIAPLPRSAARTFHLWLNSVERVICYCILMRALQLNWGRGGPQIPRRYARPANAAQRAQIGAATWRVAFGGALRHALKRRDVAERMHALYGALIHPDALAAKLARRIARGLTRRRPIRPRAQAALPLTAAPFAPCAAADTS